MSDEELRDPSVLVRFLPILAERIEARASERMRMRVQVEGDTTCAVTDGEVFFRVHLQGQQFVVTRAFRNSPEVPVLITGLISDAESLLTFELGLWARDSRWLRLAAVAPDAGCAPGFSIREESGFAILLENETGIERAALAGTPHLAELSWYANAEPDALRASLLAEDGAPVFASSASEHPRSVISRAELEQIGERMRARAAL